VQTLNTWLTVNDELKGMWKEMFMPLFKVSITDFQDKIVSQAVSNIEQE
jgi:hypothetical protein